MYDDSDTEYEATYTRLQKEIDKWKTRAQNAERELNELRQKYLLQGSIKK